MNTSQIIDQLIINSEENRESKKHMLKNSPIAFAYYFRTVCVNAGKASGHTEWALSMVNKDSIYVAHNHNAARAFKTKAIEKGLFLNDLNIFSLQSSESEIQLRIVGRRFHTVIFDECGLKAKPKENIHNFYKAIAHKNPNATFVHIGACGL